MRHGLGSEHPLCDRVRLLMVILFFAVWGLDFLSFFMFGYSTVIFGVNSFPAFFIGTVLFLSFGLYLVSKSHTAVFNEGQTQAKLIDSGVYALVRHPMYLGTLLFCLSFLFISVSLLSTAIWIAFFIVYDRMATYEEESLMEILGEQYVDYQKRVPKWFPRLHINQQK